MKPILPPTHVGDLNWPVVSYLRLDTGDTPAEFFVLVDSGEGIPNQPYATMRVLVWPDHSKTEHQDIKDFADRDARGIPAAVSALDHIAARANALVRTYQRTSPAYQP